MATNSILSINTKLLTHIVNYIYSKISIAYVVNQALVFFCIDHDSNYSTKQLQIQKEDRALLTTNYNTISSLKG